jgi:hypothetical protein
MSQLSGKYHFLQKFIPDGTNLNISPCGILKTIKRITCGRIEKAFSLVAIST